MARFCSLFSSSRGNCTYIGTADGGILIDCGVSAKKVRESLDALGIPISSIHGIFITHEHTDHISGVRVLASKENIPVYASSGTMSFMDENNILNGKFDAEVIFKSGMEIGNFFVKPFSISHDAREPFGYCIQTPDGRKISVVTDTGIVTEEILSAVSGSDLIMLESNHDIGMLQNGSYPYSTKRRILSDRGHLSNDTCAETAVQLLEKGTTRFCLAHLSHENNMPRLAFQCTYSEMLMNGAKKDEDYLLSVAGGVPEMMLL